jgi:hypothetical protein
MHRKRTVSLRFVFSAIAALTALAPAGADAQTIPIDPKATYLRTNSDVNAQPAIAIDLSALGLQAGDPILLERLNGYLPAPSLPASGATIGVFSSSNVLAAPAVPQRVLGAIDAGTDVASFPTFNGTLPTDIPEDFAIAGVGIGGTPITIPSGAQFLFVSPNDSFFGDNISLAYAVRITLLDTDRDGVLDNVDECVPSDMRTWVDTGSGATTVANIVDSLGCTIQDYVNAYQDAAQNHGQYVSAIAYLANRLAQEGVVSGKQQSELVSGAAQSGIGK